MKKINFKKIGRSIKNILSCSAISNVFIIIGAFATYYSARVAINLSNDTSPKFIINNGFSEEYDDDFKKIYKKYYFSLANSSTDKKIF